MKLNFNFKKNLIRYLCVGSSDMVMVSLVFQPPTLWNRLLVEDRNVSSLEKYKFVLKTQAVQRCLHR